MCYSVMIETDLRRLSRELDAEVDVGSLLELLEARDRGERAFKIPRGLEQSFQEPRTEEEKRCRELMDKFTDEEIGRFAAKAEEQKAKVIDFEARLAKKWSKTGQEKLDTARRVLEKASYDVTRLKGPVIPTDSVVHQYTYAPLVVRQDGKRRIRFFRYQVRPRWADREPSRELNLYNARLDKLEDRRTWAPLFMHQHAALLLRGFYEWVPDPEGEGPMEARKARIIHFFPKDRRLVWAPSLWERWTAPDGRAHVDSFAIVTTDPPPEVALMGHDRCPTHPPRAFLADWLNPESCAKAYVLAGLRSEDDVTFDYTLDQSGPPEA